MLGLLDPFASDSYHKILAVTRKGGFRLQAVEARFLGTTHAEVGEKLCPSWELSEGLTRLIARQYDPDATAHEVLTIRLADHLADAGGFANFAWQPHRPPELGLLEALGPTPDDLDELVAREGERIQERSRSCATCSRPVVSWSADQACHDRATPKPAGSRSSSPCAR